ncbi:MAG: NAD-dependent epimerase/dehydratase family protein [Mangrovibacterium sp.]
MKALITGANGLLGSNLARQLLKANYEVRAMVRESSNLLSLRGSDVEWFRGNVLDARDLKKALTGCQVVVHAAANTAQWPSDYSFYQPINVDGTRLLLDESRKAGIERFIYVGSANAFGPGSKEKPGTEESPFTNIQRQSGYMRSKYEAQQLVLEFHQRHGFPTLVVNPAFMLGKYDAKPSSGQLLLMAHKKQLMFYPTGGKNFVHVEDVACGIIRAIENGTPGECYLLAGQNLSYREFFMKMQHVCGYPKQLIHLPKPIILAAGWAGTFYERLTGKPARLNRTNARLLMAENYYSPEKAIHELQLPQTPVEQAITDALEWFGEMGKLP